MESGKTYIHSSRDNGLKIQHRTVVNMLESIKSFLHTFSVYHINAFYSIAYFLKNNYFFIIVLIAIGYMVFEELRVDNYNYTNDERRII